MKYIVITLIYFSSIALFSQTYVGDWLVSTMGAGSKASISQEKNEISVLRVLEQEFEGEKYLLYHLMKGDINDKKLKLYVKEDKFEKFEYLRDVSFEAVDSDSLKIDGKSYKKVDGELKREGSRSSATTVPDVAVQHLSNDEDDGKVEIVYLKKPKLEPKVILVEEQFMLPGGLGEKGNKAVNISSGFTGEERVLNSKAVRLMKRKYYKKALSIYLDLYKKDNKNISLLIKIENVYNIVDNKKEAKKYCSKIKRYDPFYPCGG